MSAERQYTLLLANAEVSKNGIQDVLHVDETRYLADGLSSVAQLFSREDNVLRCCPGQIESRAALYLDGHSRVSRKASRNSRAFSRCARCRACVIKGSSTTLPDSESKLYLHVGQRPLDKRRVNSRTFVAKLVRSFP